MWQHIYVAKIRCKKVLKGKGAHAAAKVLNKLERQPFCAHLLAARRKQRRGQNCWRWWVHVEVEVGVEESCWAAYPEKRAAPCA